MQETWVRSLGWENPLEKGKAPYSSILARRIPWTVWSMGSQRVRHNWCIITYYIIYIFTYYIYNYMYMYIWMLVSCTHTHTHTHTHTLVSYCCLTHYPKISDLKAVYYHSSWICWLNDLSQAHSCIWGLAEGLVSALAWLWGRSALHISHLLRTSGTAQAVLLMAVAEGQESK